MLSIVNFLMLTAVLASRGLCAHKRQETHPTLSSATDYDVLYGFTYYRYHTTLSTLLAWAPENWCRRFSQFPFCKEGKGKRETSENADTKNRKSPLKPTAVPTVPVREYRESSSSESKANPRLF
jgi:hypothetical protein